jgi:hypothetical protein
MKLIDDVNDLLEAQQDKVFYYYHGLVFAESDVFVRLDKTFLYSIRYAQGSPCVQQLVGFKEFMHGREPIARFTNEPLYKVLSGPRKGRVTTVNKVYDEEDVEKVQKPWKITQDGSISGIPSLDKFILGIVDNLVYNVPPPSTFVLPKLFLACMPDTMPDKEALLLRSTQEAAHWIKACPLYDPKKSVQDNLLDNRNTLGFDAGKRRIAFPFEFVYGKGAVVSDVQHFGVWHCTSLKDATFALPHVDVNLS